MFRQVLNTGQSKLVLFGVKLTRNTLAAEVPTGHRALLSDLRFGDFALVLIAAGWSCLLNQLLPPVNAPPDRAEMSATGVMRQLARAGSGARASSTVRAPIG